jgi:tetratricopeptide (TPR) repeat protein
MLKSIVAVAGALLLVASTGAAHAQTWLRAESEHFIAYSDGGERALRDFVVKLERFDQILRLRFGVAADQPTLRKLPIYLVARHDGLDQVAPGIGRTIAGFYTANEEDIFAVAIRNDGDETILHEYAHHFFYQHLNAPYPGWLSEGLAEYVMTARIRDDEFILGQPNANRVSWLNYGDWLPIESLLTKRFGQVARGSHQATYYPIAWLMTHWFFSTPERSRQLDSYLRLVTAGVDPADAMTQATGLTLGQLDQALTSYFRGNVYAETYKIEYRPIDVMITRMPESARDLLLLGQRIKRPLSEEGREEALAEVRRRAARWPDDALAQLILGHAELHMGDTAVGETILLRVLELDPDNDEALQYLATGRIRQAEDSEDPDQRRSLLGEARGFLARAYAIDPDDYFTLTLIAETREGQPGYPNENDMRVWEAAFDGAPQLASIRLGYGRALIASGDLGEAFRVLTPLANSPHGGTAADSARSMIAAALGEAPPEPEAVPEDAEPASAEGDQAG